VTVRDKGSGFNKALIPMDSGMEVVGWYKAKSGKIVWFFRTMRWSNM